LAEERGMEQIMQRRWLLIFLSIILVTLACSVNPSGPTDEEMLDSLESTPDIAATASSEVSGTSAATVTAMASPIVYVEPTLPPSTYVEEITITDPQEIVKKAVLEETYIYAVQLGSPVAMTNWSHPELGCNWLGLAGQIFGLDDVPVQGIVVEAGGTLEGEIVLGLSITGVTDLYGPGSYEIQLADHAVASQKQVWVQVKGATGEALSPQILIDTYNDCEQNLILLNFVQVEPYSVEYHIYLPLIMQ